MISEREKSFEDEIDSQSVYNHRYYMHLYLFGRLLLLIFPLSFSFCRLFIILSLLWTRFKQRFFICFKLFQKFVLSLLFNLFEVVLGGLFWSRISVHNNSWNVPLLGRYDLNFHTFSNESFCWLISQHFPGLFQDHLRVLFGVTGQLRERHFSALLHHFGLLLSIVIAHNPH